jgi:mRNA-degrading endonuclease RelE of RelBE toxin-antitoxin system
MTQTGAGGVVVKTITPSKTFERQFKKLPQDIKDSLKDVFKDLLQNPRPSGLRFEKLKGYKKPDIYTVHITGNYKLSFEIDGCQAKLRCVGNHNEIDRRP